MPIYKWPLNETLVSQMFEFANTPFVLDHFRERWTRFGWSYEPRPGDEFGFRVDTGGGLALSIDPSGNRVTAATLPFCYFEDCDPQFRSDFQKYEEEREAYNSEFLSAVQLVQRTLKAPFADWQDTNGDAHSAKIWAGDHGLMILQQANFDPQFGIELSFWLAPLSRIDIAPTSPLIEWLCQLSHAEHKQHGFPKIPW